LSSSTTNSFSCGMEKCLEKRWDHGNTINQAKGISRRVTFNEIYKIRKNESIKWILCGWICIIHIYNIYRRKCFTTNTVTQICLLNLFTPWKDIERIYEVLQPSAIKMKKIASFYTMNNHARICNIVQIATRHKFLILISMLESEEN